MLAISLHLYVPSLTSVGIPSSQSEGWLPPEAAAAILGAAVGGLLAILGGLFTQLFVAWRERKRRKTNLLIALQQEVRSLQGVLQTAWELREKALEKNVIASGFFVPWTSLSPHHFQVYSGAGSDLALLPSQLIGPIVAFYGSVSGLNELVITFKNEQNNFVEEWSRFLAQRVHERFEAVLAEAGNLIGQMQAEVTVDKRNT